MPDRQQRRDARRLALASIAVAGGVMALKFAAWWLTGSVALLSDALETIVNVLAALVTWVAVGYAARPADEDHPFGHHKAEYLAAVLEGVLIVGAATLIVVVALAELASPARGAPGALGPGIAVNLLAAGINAGWAAFLLARARALRSPALAADARHVRADVVTSLGVVAGLVLAALTGWWVLDPLLALLVALIVVWQGARVLLGSLGGLMDRVVPEDEAAAILASIETAMTGAIEVHDVRIREAGAAVFLDCHLVVPAAMSVGAAHVICDRIEDALRAQHPHLRATIHVEPEDEARGAPEGSGTAARGTTARGAAAAGNDDRACGGGATGNSAPEGGPSGPFPS